MGDAWVYSIFESDVCSIWRLSRIIMIIGCVCRCCCFSLYKRKLQESSSAKKKKKKHYNREPIFIVSSRLFNYIYLRAKNNIHANIFNSVKCVNILSTSSILQCMHFALISIQPFKIGRKIIIFLQFFTRFIICHWEFNWLNAKRKNKSTSFWCILFLSLACHFFPFYFVWFLSSQIIKKFCRKFFVWEI